jgi:hypothetical protein
MLSKVWKDACQCLLQTVINYNEFLRLYILNYYLCHFRNIIGVTFYKSVQALRDYFIQKLINFKILTFNPKGHYFSIQIPSTHNITVYIKRRNVELICVTSKCLDVNRSHTFVQNRLGYSMHKKYATR